MKTLVTYDYVDVNVEPKVVLHLTLREPGQRGAGKKISVPLTEDEVYEIQDALSAV